MGELGIRNLETGSLALSEAFTALKLKSSCRVPTQHLGVPDDAGLNAKQKMWTAQCQGERFGFWVPVIVRRLIW